MENTNMTSNTTMPVIDLISFDNPVFRGYTFYCCILVIKVLLMAFLTSMQRMKKKVFSNPEDARIRDGATVAFDDPDVERVRRAHLNDLENIPAFLFVAFLYVLTNPNVVFALMLFRIYTIARILHTVFYAIVPLPQPTRAILFLTGMLITLFMALMVIITFVQF